MKTGKKVIFVGGASYSGTTLLDMMLSNNPDGFSCGELIGIFYPRRRHHIEYLCGCGKPDCRVWPSAISLGPSPVYKRIFEQFPNVRYIVDSSKDPGWIRRRAADLHVQGIGVTHVLIWKAPRAFQESWIKRTRPAAWLRAWSHYHLVYAALIKNWFSISYSDLVNRPDALKLLCERLGIPFHEGQARYWEKVQHTLFGNSSAKVHLYGKDSAAYSACITDMAQNQHREAADVRSVPDEMHRTIYQEAGSRSREAVPELPSDGVEGRLLQVLRAHDVLQEAPTPRYPFSITPLDRLKVPVLRAWWAARRRLESLLTRVSLCLSER